MALSESPRRSLSSNSSRPELTRALGGRSRITASADTDLPQPDSPTSAKVSPGSIAKEVERTATCPGKAMVSPSTLSKLMDPTAD